MSRIRLTVVDITAAQSLPSHHVLYAILNVVAFLFTKLASLSLIRNSSAPTGVDLSVVPWMSTFGVTANGFPLQSNHICCGLVPLIYVSFPDESTTNTRFAVRPVRRAPTLSSLFVLRLLILAVLPLMSQESASRADLIAPETVARVNICARVIL